MKKVFVAMSGGVDSSVAAALLKKQGYFVAGGYMKNFSEESWEGVIGSDCPWKQDIKDVKAVCKKLGIEFRSFNFEKEYSEKVIEYFFREYAAGRTPNPDIMCNKEIKFGLFLNKARELGFDYVATGHYARIKATPHLTSPTGGEEFPPLDGEGKGGVAYELLKGLDPKKDQSYFLYMLTQNQLKHTLFPIGNLTKPEVRKLARKFGLPNWDKKDSQGVCFIGHINLREFLKQRLPERAGDIVNSSGRVLGQHPGAWYYTIGQRHGLALGGGTPYYVAQKDVKKNVIIVAEGKADEFVYSKTAIIKNIHWIDKSPFSPMKRGRTRGGKQQFHCSAKIRYQQPDQSCTIFSPSQREGGEQEGVRVIFDKPQFAIAPGQAIVFYDGDRVLAGGIIR